MIVEVSGHVELEGSAPDSDVLLIYLVGVLNDCPGNVRAGKMALAVFKGGPIGPMEGKFGETIERRMHVSLG